MTDFGTEAAALADKGFRVFPVSPGHKVPTANSRGCSDATADADQVRRWWEHSPGCNVGVSTDGLIVVDVDPATEPDDREQQTEWLRVNQERLFNAANAVSQTPRGGKHYWFRSPAGANYRNTASVIAPGIDTRANGGYVVGPPSCLTNRGDGLPGLYTWVFESADSVDSWSVAPDWLLMQLESKEYSENAGQRGEHVEWEYEPIPKRHRNASLASIGGHLRHRGLTREEIQSVLLLRNQLCCQPPLSENEVKHIAASVSKYAPDQVATAMAFGWENWWLSSSSPAPSGRKMAVNPGVFPKHLLNPGGFLQSVIDWNLETAIKPQPELALAGALALLSVLTGRNITDCIGSRTNLYVLGVCDSGGGKEHARKVNKKILSLNESLSKRLGNEGFASHSGVVSAVSDRLTVLFQLDEIGRMLATLSNPSNSPHLFNIVTVLLKMFSSSNSVYIGDAYADSKKTANIEQPHAVVYGTTVKGSLLQSLTRDSLSDGFVARLLAFVATDNDPDPRKAKMGAVPDEIAEAAVWWDRYMPSGLIGEAVPNPRVLEDSEDAEHVFDSLDALVRRRKADQDDGVNIWSRCAEKARKLALLHTVSIDREAVEIPGESAQWGSDVASYLTELMEFLASRWVGESGFDSQQLRVVRLLEGAEAGLSKNDILHGTRGWRMREREEVLLALETMGTIVKESVATKGRPATVYKLNKPPEC